MSQSKKTFSYQLPEPMFRISAASICLTYKNLPNNVSANQVIEQLKKKVNFSKYFCTEILQKDGTKNFVFFLTKENKKKFDIRIKKKLQVEFQGKNYDGIYEKVTSLIEQMIEQSRKGAYTGTISFSKDKQKKVFKYFSNRKIFDNNGKQVQITKQESEIQAAEIYFDPNQDTEGTGVLAKIQEWIRTSKLESLLAACGSRFTQQVV